MKNTWKKLSIMIILLMCITGCTSKEANNAIHSTSEARNDGLNDLINLGEEVFSDKESSKKDEIVIADDETALIKIIDYGQESENSKRFSIDFYYEDRANLNYKFNVSIVANEKEIRSYTTKTNDKYSDDEHVHSIQFTETDFVKSFKVDVSLVEDRGTGTFYTMPDTIGYYSPYIYIEDDNITYDGTELDSIYEYSLTVLDYGFINVNDEQLYVIDYALYNNAAIPYSYEFDDFYLNGYYIDYVDKSDLVEGNKTQYFHVKFHAYDLEAPMIDTVENIEFRLAYASSPDRVTYAGDQYYTWNNYSFNTGNSAGNEQKIGASVSDYEVIAIDNEYVSAAFRPVYLDDNGKYQLEVLYINKTDDDIYFYLGNERYNEKPVSIGGEVVAAKKTYADSCWLYNFPKDENAHELSFDLIAVRESDISSHDLSVWYTYHTDEALGYAENVIVPVP